MSWFAGLEHIVRESEPLAPLTWLRLGGPADFFAEPTTTDELEQLVRRCDQEQLPVRLIGGGSNVMVPDEGVKGVVIQLSAPAFCEIHVAGNHLQAGGGTKLGHVVATAVREGLGGLESLVGVPGTVAGAIKNNSDSHGTSIGAWVKEATLMNRSGQIVTRSDSELQFGHRQSNIDELVVLSVRFALESQESTDLTRRMQKRWIVRRGTQPSGENGTARAFIDPPGLTASQVIDDAGLKGSSVGGAQVSERSANFIEVMQGATSSDVVKLLEMMQQRVEEQLGVQLQRELRIW